MGEYGQYIVPTADTMINFKVGQPAPSMLPLDLIRQASAKKFEENDPMFLQYGHIWGYPRFRDSLAGFLSDRYQHSVDPEKLFVTNGVTGGLSLICSLFCQAGDLVFLEEPSYFLALSIMKDFNLKTRQIPMEQDGLNVEALEQVLKRGIVPKMFYTVPTCHNPTGRTMSFNKRKRLVELSIEYGFMIVADEVYQLLSFPSVTPPPPMFTFDTNGTVLALGSFSKILAPALRLGWIQGHKNLLKKIADCGQLDSSGGINPVISGIVHSSIQLNLQQKHLDWTRETLWSRASTLMKSLKEHLPKGTTFEKPDGGYFILVRLPEHMNASELLTIAQKHKVMYLPGSSFAKSMSNYLRLSFSWYSDDDLALGARRLANAIKEYHENYANKKQPINISNVSSTSSKSKISVHGGDGRMGSLIMKELEISTQMESCGMIPKDGMIPPASEVVIDVTCPEGTSQLLKTLENDPKPLVVGTTGDLPMEQLRAYAQKAPVVIKSNFSVGVPLLCDLVKRTVNALPEGWNCGIMEIHHTKKLDAPSGTAKTIKKAIESTGASILETSIPCESLRLGDEIGQHTVYFAGPGERIEIKHQATRREVFAIGALRTAEWILKQPKGLYIF